MGKLETERSLHITNDSRAALARRTPSSLMALSLHSAGMSSWRRSWHRLRSLSLQRKNRNSPGCSSGEVSTVSPSRTLSTTCSLQALCRADATSLRSQLLEGDPPFLSCRLDRPIGCTDAHHPC